MAWITNKSSTDSNRRYGFYTRGLLMVIVLFVIAGVILTPIYWFYKNTSLVLIVLIIILIVYAITIALIIEILRRKAYTQRQHATSPDSIIEQSEYQLPTAPPRSILSSTLPERPTAPSQSALSTMIRENYPVQENFQQNYNYQNMYPINNIDMNTTVTHTQPELELRQSYRFSNEYPPDSWENRSTLRLENSPTYLENEFVETHPLRHHSHDERVLRYLGNNYDNRNRICSSNSYYSAVTQEHIV